jgi:hypothetical protein
MSHKELLALVVVVPLFLFLSSLFPLTRVLFVVLWVVYLGFDVASTYVFYLEDPGQFQNNERNKLFVWLTKKVGFKKAALLFPLIIEIPLLLFFAVIPLQILYVNMFPLTSNNLWACFAASLGISAVGHLQAAVKNIRYNHKTKPNNTTKEHNFNQDNQVSTPKKAHPQKKPKIASKVTYLDQNML